MEEYLYAFRQTRSMEGIALALGYLATMAADMGDFEAAARAAEEGMGIRQRISLRGQEAHIVYDVALVNFLQAKMLAARRLIEKAVLDVRETDETKTLVPALLLLGRISCYEGRIEEAISLLQDCLNMIEPWYVQTIAEIKLCLGYAACLHGDYDEAAMLYRQSLESRRGALPALPGPFEKMADLALRRSQPLRAATLLGAAGQLRKKMGLPVPPFESREYDQNLQVLAAQMDEKSMAEAWSAGAAMSVESSIAFALEQ
jgi:tetratricopeptide (TPR) repeat protein